MLAVKRDIEHLKLLAIFHFVLAALTALLHSVPIIHIVLGVMMLNGTFPGARPGTPGAPPAFMGWFFVGIGSVVVFWGWSLAFCLTIAGFGLLRRKWRTFCCVVAGYACLHPPFGTALGVCTLLVLLRQSVRDLFAGKIVEPHYPDDDDDNYEPPRHRPARRGREEDRESTSRRDDDRFTFDYDR
jgi:hypothetical protein